MFGKGGGGGGENNTKSTEFSEYSVVVFNKTIIPLALIGYEMTMANLVLRTLLAIYHLVSKARLWNEFKI